ncbi:MAG: hypothetical protein IJW54_03880 [Clostridia bacterium]|nr:hypothetical protein [Clostridia bacterium]
MSYCQFTLSLDGKSYIRGELTHTQGEFFTVESPKPYGCSLSIDKTEPADNKIKLSKSAVIYYFEIENNQI